MPKEGEGEGECERRKKVGHYVLGPCLGEGSFAKVRMGTHIISREKVAVKIVSKRVIIRREAARRNFRREALLLQHVRHPHIVRLFEAMETPNSYYLVFELAPKGHLLGYVTARKCLREGEARRFMRQIVSAVDHLHRSFIVHRDLKLENCLLNANLDIKIIDFGLSALCQRESGLHTQCGSPAYAAPEIFGNRRYGPAVDLWSVGVCLYAMVVGRLPFLPHPTTNLPQLHALILKGPVIPTFLSAGLQQLLTGLLEVQESRRLSVSDLLHQSWLTSNRSQPITRYPPLAQATAPPVDTHIVRYMSSVFCFDESDVIHSVTERKLNASSATYHLLQRHMEGERSPEESHEGDGVKDAEKGDEKEKVVGNVYNRPLATDYIRLVASDYGRSAAKDSSRPVVSEYSKSSVDDSERAVAKGEGGDGSLPAAAEFRSVVSCDGDGREGGGSSLGCPVLRSHILPTSTHAPSGDSGEDRGGEKKKEGGEGPKDYKQCILYLKEARHAFALGGRPLSYLQPHLDKTTAKLPLLNLHRHSYAGRLHGSQTQGSVAQAAEGHQCGDSGRHQGQGLDSHDVKLNIKGRPALMERVKGVVGDRGDNSSLTSGSHVSFTSQDAGRPPPPPPNTAQGVRIPMHVPSPPGTPRPSTAGSGRSQCSLKDPFGRDMWQTVLQQHDARLAGESEAETRNAKGVSFVAPLSSPKALTSRGVGTTSRQAHNYFLVRQLTADLNRKRATVNKKPTPISSVPHPLSTHSAHHLHPLPHPHPHQLHHHHLKQHQQNASGHDDDSDDDKVSQASSAEKGYGDSLERERFLTPVIRVTITSTAKQ